MRKYIIGGLVGIVLAVGASAHAEVEGVVGKVVDGLLPVKVNGTNLEKQAIIIEGTSYLPVRAVADVLGMEATYSSEQGIELKQKQSKAEEGVNVADPVTETEKGKTKNTSALRTELRQKIAELESQQEQLYEIISSYEIPLSNTPYTDEEYKTAKRKFEENILEIRAIQEQIMSLFKPK